MTSLSPSLAAGLLLAALPLLRLHEFPAPTGTAVLEATGASRTTAYKIRGDLLEILPRLLKPAGRPPKPPPEVDPQVRLDLAYKVRDFLIAHPGCVTGSQRQRYSHRFHVFVLELCEAPELPLQVVAEASGVPLGTLKDWMRGEPLDVRPDEQNLTEVSGPAPSRIESVLTAFERWDGPFKAFCEHVWFDLRIPFSRQLITDLLQSHGVRIPSKRRRDPDASAARGGFETFFPNAQWVGDGTELVIELLGQRVTVNLELLVDADKGAFTGASIRPTEDATAVTEAFADGVATTSPPTTVGTSTRPSETRPSVCALVPTSPRTSPRSRGPSGCSSRRRRPWFCVPRPSMASPRRSSVW